MLGPIWDSDRQVGSACRRMDHAERKRNEVAAGRINKQTGTGARRSEQRGRGPSPLFKWMESISKWNVTVCFFFFVFADLAWRPTEETGSQSRRRVLVLAALEESKHWGETQQLALVWEGSGNVLGQVSFWSAALKITQMSESHSWRPGRTPTLTVSHPNHQDLWTNDVQPQGGRIRLS